MRRPTDDEASLPSHRWMLSWSDFVTLLLVVFAALYAQASHGPVPCGTPTALSTLSTLSTHSTQSAHSTEHSAQLTLLSIELQQALQSADGTGFTATVIPVAEGVLLELHATLLFASGDARLTSPLRRALEAIAPVLIRHDYPLAIEGYADAVPISNRQYPSNWELSAARAASVARLFTLHGVTESRIEVTGRGTNLAVTDNATPEARQANRRVQILVRVAAGNSTSRAVTELR